MQPKIIPVEISARHVHLSRRMLNILFGENYELTVKKPLSQPGEFLAEERLELVGEKGRIKNIAILGPTRPHTQVEVSITDARKLGVVPPIRESGVHEGSASCELVGPAGDYTLDDGVIVAKRHLHLSSDDAKTLNVKNGDLVSVEIKHCLRPLIFKDVLVRVKDTYATSLHLDTDEGNAAGLTADSYGVIIK